MAIRTPGFVGGVLATAFAVALGFGLIVPALPAFARELGASIGATSAVISTFAAVRLLASGPAGALVDRLGARRNVAAGLLIVAASSAATALAGSYLELIVLRGAGGLGSALFITGIGQYVVVAIPNAERGRANGLLQGSFLLGGASGPAVGGIVVEWLGIRAPFVVYAATLLLATAFTLRYLRPTGTPARGAERPDPVPTGSALRHLFADRTFVAVLVVYVVVSWASQGARFVGIPLFGEEELGAGPAQIGLVLTVGSIAQGLALWPSSRFADARGRLLPIRIGTAAFAVAMIGLALTTSVPALFVWMAVLGGAAGISSSVPAAVVGDLAPLGMEGKAVGAMNVARDVGAVLGPLVTGVVADAAGFPAAFGLAAALLVLGFGASLAMRETLVSDQPPSSA